MKNETELLEECPGLVGDVARAIDRSFSFPEPQISLGTAFATIGALKSDRFAYGSMHCHGYHGIIARAGLGKTIAQDLAARICTIAEQPELITGDSTSEAGLISALIVSPRRLIIMDELGRAFEQMGLDKGGYRQELLSVLLKLYSCANGVYHGKNYANKEPVVIHRPLVSMLGGSTPHAFFAGMTPRLAHDGMLSRFFLWFASGASIHHQTGDFCLPGSAVSELAAINENGQIVGNISNRRTPCQIMFEDKTAFDLDLLRYDLQTRAYKGDLESSLFARAKEQFVKLCIALVDKNGLVGVDEVHYANQLLTFLYQQTLTQCEKLMGTGERDLTEAAYSDRIFAFISEQCAINNDGKVQASVVSREFRSGKARKIAIDELIEQERIFVTKVGRSMKLYSTVPNEESFQDRIAPFTALDPTDPATYSQEFPRNQEFPKNSKRNTLI